MTHSGDWLMQAELEKAMELGGLAEKLQESLQREKRETARLAEALESADLQLEVQIRAFSKAKQQEAEKVQQAIKQREDSEAEKGEEVQQLQQQMGSLVLEAGSLKKETEKAAADWEKKELKKYKQKIAQLEEETQAKSEVLQKAEETVGTHVHMLVNAKLELAEQA
eukprot:gene29550-36814_t